MPRFRVIHRQAGETWEVEASYAENARQVIGWPLGICSIQLMLKAPFEEIEPPKSGMGKSFLSV